MTQCVRQNDLNFHSGLSDVYVTRPKCFWCPKVLYDTIICRCITSTLPGNRLVSNSCNYRSKSRRSFLL